MGASDALDYETPAPLAAGARTPPLPIHLYDNGRAVNALFGWILLCSGVLDVLLGAGSTSFTSPLMLSMGVGSLLLALAKPKPCTTFADDHVVIGRGRRARRIARADLVASHERKNGMELVTASGEAVRLDYFVLRRSSVEQLRALMPGYLRPDDAPAPV